MRYSVLLPTRNGGEIIENCILSILNQQCYDMELIVSDNANTDKTQEVLASFSEDSRLKVIRCETPVPVSDNWNKAFNTSSGDYILMMGDDDCLLPDYFEKMDQILETHQFPDCITYSGYSYISPHSVNNNAEGFYLDPFYEFGPEFVEGLMSHEFRLSIVKDMFRFKVRIPLNMQTHLISRRARNYIEGDIFRPPFPDHFAINALMMLAKSWVFAPQKLVVLGVSPKSFGHFVFSNKEAEGIKYLEIDSNFAGKLPGTERHNGMYMWLNLLKTNFSDKLQGIEINRPGYVRRQVYSWYQQYRAEMVNPRELLKWFGMLSLSDWVGLIASIFDKRSWEQIGSLFFGGKDYQVQNVWQEAIPIKKISNIKEFVNWISDRPKIENQATK